MYSSCHQLIAPVRPLPKGRKAHKLVLLAELVGAAEDGLGGHINGLQSVALDGWHHQERAVMDCIHPVDAWAELHVHTWRPEEVNSLMRQEDFEHSSGPSPCNGESQAWMTSMQSYVRLPWC